MSSPDRYTQGIELMEKIQGPAAAATIRASFDEISPDSAATWSRRALPMSTGVTD